MLLSERRPGLRLVLTNATPFHPCGADCVHGNFPYERSFVVTTLPIASSGFLIVFLELLESFPEAGSTTFARTFVWLGFKALVFVITKVWAKAAYYGTGDDIQAMLLVFTMVIPFYCPQSLTTSFVLVDTVFLFHTFTYAPHLSLYRERRHNLFSPNQM